jgi:putative transcriptional regulator
VITCLAAIRADRRLTQADVAAMANVSRQTINSIETGRFEPSLSLALTLARLFERPVEQMFALPDATPGWETP